VLLTNITHQELRVWTEEYSWGYDNLSFIVTRANGGTFHIVRQPEAFTMNIPVYYLVKPGGHYAWSVTLSPSTWTGFPDNWTGSEKVTIQAQLETKSTLESKENNVWTGKVLSMPMKVTLIRFPRKDQVYFERVYPDH